MSEKEIVKEILNQALDADEKDDKEKAVEFYTKAVETILKISDPILRERLNKYAVQALDRAEELRGISSSTHQTQAQNFSENHANNMRVQCKSATKSKQSRHEKCIIIMFSFILATNTTKFETIKPIPRPRATTSSSSSSGYTEDEKRVLNHTSNINDNIFVPFMDVDLKDRFVFSIPFTDKVMHLF